MASGGKREGAGRKPIDGENKSIKFSIRLPEKILKAVSELGTGDNEAQKLRDIIEKGIKSVKENQDK